MHDFHYRNRQLMCEDVAIEALIKKHGTPLFVYSQPTLSGHFQALDTAMAGSITWCASPSNPTPTSPSCARWPIWAAASTSSAAANCNA